MQLLLFSKNRSFFVQFALFMGILFFPTLVKSQLKSENSIQNTKTFLPRSTPESEGVASKDIANLLDEISKSGIQFHSIMVLRHGNVLAEGWWQPYQANYKHQLYSLSKSFTSTAVGFAVQEGLLDVNAKVVSFFPEDVPQTIPENLANLTVHHLLSMTVGQKTEPLDAMRNNDTETWEKTFLSSPIELAPGSKFMYNTAATYMLSAIVQKVSKQKLIDFLQSRLFVPLGIESADWEENQQNTNLGGFGLRVSTEAIAKLGQFYLQKGKWNGKQLLAESWIAEATRKHINSTPDTDVFDAKNDWAQGYGYQFWRNHIGGYRADGAFGQYCIVLPEKDMVIAVTSESFDMGKSMQLLWQNLVNKVSETKLAPNKKEQQLLSKKLKKLEITAPSSNFTIAGIKKIVGKKYEVAPNEIGLQTLEFFQKSSKILTLKITTSTGTSEIDCGIHGWQRSAQSQTNNQNLFNLVWQKQFASKIAVNTCFTESNVLQLQCRFVEYAHGDEVNFTFDKEYKEIKISFLSSMAKGRNEKDSRQTITAKAKL